MKSTATVKARIVLTLAGVLLSGTASPLQGQGADRFVSADDHFHHHHLGLMVGGMTPLSETSETSFALGLEYEYRFSQLWGAGLGVDFTFGDHKRTALVATGVTYRLTPDFKLITGPGFEVVEKDKPEGGTKSTPYFLWGFGAAYDFHVGSITLTPTVFLDFVGETKTNLTYGIAIGTGF